MRTSIKDTQINNLADENEYVISKTFVEEFEKSNELRIKRFMMKNPRCNFEIESKRPIDNNAGSYIKFDF